MELKYLVFPGVPYEATTFFLLEHARQHRKLNLELLALEHGLTPITIKLDEGSEIRQSQMITISKLMEYMTKEAERRDDGLEVVTPPPMMYEEGTAYSREYLDQKFRKLRSSVDKDF